MRAEPFTQTVPLRLGLPMPGVIQIEPTDEPLGRMISANRPYLSMGAWGVNGRKNGNPPWCLSRAKRIMDIVLAAVFCVLALPLCIPIAMAISLENPGGVFFRQWRTGLCGRRFQMVKFRTMVKDAEQRMESLRHMNRHGERALTFKIPNDPRVTTIGRFLRRTSLDELPNLINVLKGDMSIIGPRPTASGVDLYENWHLGRLTVPPGMTGLWQISGRGEVGFDEQVKLDYQYVQDQSPILDLKILALTPIEVIGGRGAC